jgi:hypothetical protein
MDIRAINDDVTAHVSSATVTLVAKDDVGTIDLDDQ